MSYIITAEVDTREEINQGGDRSKVKARTLSEGNGVITFYVKGDFMQNQALVLGLCKDLVDAGFIEFKIGHSY